MSGKLIKKVKDAIGKLFQQPEPERSSPAPSKPETTPPQADPSKSPEPHAPEPRRTPGVLPIPRIRITPPPDNHLLVYEPAPKRMNRSGRTLFHIYAVQNRPPLVREERLMAAPLHSDPRFGPHRVKVFRSLPDLMKWHVRSRGYATPYVDACQWAAMYPVHGGKVLSPEMQKKVLKYQAARGGRRKARAQRRKSGTAAAGGRPTAEPRRSDEQEA